MSVEETTKLYDLMMEKYRQKKVQEDLVAKTYTKGTFVHLTYPPFSLGQIVEIYKPGETCECNGIKFDADQITFIFEFFDKSWGSYRKIHLFVRDITRPGNMAFTKNEKYFVKATNARERKEGEIVKYVFEKKMLSSDPIFKVKYQDGSEEWVWDCALEKKEN